MKNRFACPRDTTRTRSPYLNVNGMEDPFLNYFTLGLLFFVVIVLVYGIIAIHDIPGPDRARASSSTRGRDPRRWLEPKEAVAELEELRHRMAEVEARLEIGDRKADFGERQLQP